MFEDDLFIEDAIEVEYLIAGGGGSGGAAVDGSTGRGGGGGAGRLLTGLARLTVGSYPIVVGLGGAARPAGGNNGLNGGASTAFGLSAPGGGGGGTPTQNGLSGGSGGGGGSINSLPRTTGGAATLGTPDPGLGNAGGEGATSGTWGSGGGAGGAGATGGAGGAGVVSAISGSAVEYCHGGGGSTTIGTPGTGGNIGNGFGGGDSDAGQNGIAIARYRGPPRGTGGTITSAAGWTIHTFTTNGTLVLVG